MQRFNNAEEVFAYYANLNGDFKVVEEAFKELKTTNASLIKELADTKMESMEFKMQNELLIKEQADTNLILMEIQNKVGGTV